MAKSTFSKHIYYVKYFLQFFLLYSLNNCHYTPFLLKVDFFVLGSDHYFSGRGRHDKSGK